MYGAVRAGKVRPYAEHGPMQHCYLPLEHLPRAFGVVPPVRSIANMANHPLVRRQEITGLQICLRFHGTSPSACVNIDGRDYEAKYPHLIVKREGEVHLIRSHEAADAFYFTYAPHHAPDIPAALVVSELALTPAIHGHIHRVLELLPHSFESGVTDRLDGLCLQLLIELLLQCGQALGADEDTERIRKVTSYLQVNFTDALNFDAIARHFGYSPRSFYRHWQQHHGVSPARYVASLRLAEAQRLLTESELSVEAIGQPLGHSSSAYFVYSFRKQTGLTPRQYRQAARP